MAHAGVINATIINVGTQNAVLERYDDGLGF